MGDPKKNQNQPAPDESTEEKDKPDTTPDEEVEGESQK